MCVDPITVFMSMTTASQARRAMKAKQDEMSAWARRCEALEWENATTDIPVVKRAENEC